MKQSDLDIFFLLLAVVLRDINQKKQMVLPLEVYVADRDDNLLVHFSNEEERRKLYAFGDPQGALDFSKLQFPVTVTMTDANGHSDELLITQDLIAAILKEADRAIQ